ncbi:SAV_915 family protein [Streptomyces sp. NPDC001260]|uniref:SAV_915 family protein n=1 Tax=Streptomyces sp. NPDC001260 TaxID=3364551 RepID=UPI0036A0AB97
MDADRLVVAPAHPVGAAGDRRVIFESGRDVLGQRVGLAFTNVERLVKAMGERQPWICLPIRALRDFHLAAGVDRLVVNAQFQVSALGDK